MGQTELGAVLLPGQLLQMECGMVICSINAFIFPDFKRNELMTLPTIDEDLSVSANCVQSELMMRAGFLVRRLHQIHVALFFEECGDFDVTPVQYSLMSALRSGEMDQKSLAETIGMDHATTTNVIKRLESAGWLQRRVANDDRRRRIVRLTPTGDSLLDAMHESAQRAHERTISHLDPHDRVQFVAFLTRLVEAGNHHGRAPLTIR